MKNLKGNLENYQIRSNEPDKGVNDLNPSEEKPVTGNNSNSLLDPSSDLRKIYFSKVTSLIHFATFGIKSGDFEANETSRSSSIMNRMKVERYKV